MRIVTCMSHAQTVIVLIVSTLYSSVLIINFRRSADPKTNFERVRTKFERISYLENSLIIYQLGRLIPEALTRIGSVSLGIIYSLAYMSCAFFICFLFSNKGDGMEKTLVLGILVLVLSVGTILLSVGGQVFTMSIALQKKWKLNLHAEYTKNSSKTAKGRFRRFQSLLKSLAPIRIELGGCWHLDQRSLISFYETVLDKTILLPNVFQSLKSIN